DSFVVLVRQRAVPLNAGTGCVFVLNSTDVLNNDTSVFTAIQTGHTVLFGQVQTVDACFARVSRDEVVHDERYTVVAQHRSTEVFHHNFGRADINGTQQSAISTQMLGAHHDAVRTQIFHRVDQFVEHGEGHGSAFDIDLLIVVH